MSATDTSELSALLTLESAGLPQTDVDLPEIEPANDAQDDGPNGIEKGRKSGQAIQAGITPAPDRFTPEYRRRVCALALPALTEGATLQDVAADVGVGALTLRGWLISIDELAYKDALAGQVGAQLAQFGDKMSSCLEEIEDARARTLNHETATIGEGRDTRYALIGPELAKIARARAGILSDASRLLHWQAEKRLPKLFTADDSAGSGQVRASFSFVINGQPAQGGGRILQQGTDRPTIEQGERSATSFDNIPILRSVSAIPTLPEEVIPSPPADGSDPTTPGQA